MCEAYVAMVKLPSFGCLTKFYFATKNARNEFVHAHPESAFCKRGKPELVYPANFERTRMNVAYYFA